ILDRQGRIICAFIGTPEDPEWPNVVAQAVEAMKEAREQGLAEGAFSAGDLNHRRGSFWSVTGGVSHGGGQKRPGNLVLPRRQRRILLKLRRNKSVRRICGLQSSGFRTFGPKMFKEYVTTLMALFDKRPGLEHNFTNSIFPVVTFNLGPESVTYEHLDYHNNALGWCGITSGGQFDPKRSALLYLKQLKLVVEFPSASSTLIPSAVIDHGNTPLTAGESRYSITQYASGGLFRWVKYGFKTTKQ
ncbi:hypothetical protein C8R44DRAFT_536995, partial [Mycena epipterygia]